MKLIRAGLLTKILITVFLVYAVTMLIGLRSKIETAETEKKALEHAVNDVLAQNAELKYYIDNSEDAQVKEDIARDHDYVKRDEKVYKAGE